jgi:hypothetical protein
MAIRVWAVLVLTLACSGRDRLVPESAADRPRQSNTPERPLWVPQTLAASFVSRDTAMLRALLHPDLVVQPPAPDSARQGADAIDYLLELAAQTSVSESRLYSHMSVPEGPFVYEQGVWLMRSGTRALRAPYSLRWRAAGRGWQVVLWRWGAFR